MALKTAAHRFTGPTTPISSYDEDLTNLGSLIKQYTGANAADKFAGPMKIGMARPMEASTAIPGMYPHCIRISPTKDWIFLADNAAAAGTRRIILYEFDRETSSFSWQGFVTLTYPPSTNHTIRGIRALYNKYTTGTVAVSGTGVTGTGTTWTTDRMNVGCRIGFGSTDPNQISTWYEISAVGSNTSITLTTSAGTISAGTSYVIEDLSIITANTNATAANGGLFMAKGLSLGAFNSTVTIPAATTTDNIRAVYWLADAATVINTATAGCALGGFTSWTDQRVYCIDTNRRVYVYNVRVALAGLASGKSTSALVFATGILASAFTGTLSQANNGRIATLSHGPGSGVESLYFATTTRIYRAAVTSITDGNTAWTSDVMVEIPPGGTATYAAGSVMSAVEYASTIDRLFISTTGAAGVRSYVTKYNTNSDQFDHIFLVDDKQLDQSTADSGGVPHPSINASAMSFWVEDGVLFVARHSTVATLNQLYSVPVGVHRSYAMTTNELLVTPKLSMPDAESLVSVYTNFVLELGDSTFSLMPEPFDLYYRTSGISDNSGTWVPVPAGYDMTGIQATQIQFAFTFRMIGSYCLPARIFGIAVTYESATSTDSHYEPSVALSSIPGNEFAYRQKAAWGSNIPNLRIRIYNAETEVIIVDDDITSAAGTWEYSDNNGASWNAWDNTEDVVGNYIRYIPTSLPSGVRVRALLTQA